MYFCRLDFIIKGGKMVIYDEVLNILFELEKKVFNYYNVVKVGMC